MSCDERSVPNVWICLVKIKKYIEGEYNDPDAKEDVLCCIKVLERMFLPMDMEVKFKARIWGCRNGWEDDDGRG